jgi:hypothetical protein
LDSEYNRVNSPDRSPVNHPFIASHHTGLEVLPDLGISRTTRIALCLLAGGLTAGLAAFRSDVNAGNKPVSVSMPLPPPPELKPVPSTPIAEQKAVLGDDETWRPEWDAMIEKDLPDGLLSPKMGGKVAEFCPRFGVMSEPDRRAFWAYFFQALSGAEAGLKPTADVRHTQPQVGLVDGVSHRMIRSEGLLQLTYEDAERYGCDFDWHADKDLSQHDPERTILRPRNNLLCGVSILDNQLIVQKRPLLSAHSYWSTLRPGWPGYHLFLKQMRNVPSACERNRTGTPKTSEATETLAASH